MFYVARGMRFEVSTLTLPETEDDGAVAAGVRRGKGGLRLKQSALFDHSSLGRALSRSTVLRSRAANRASLVPIQVSAPRKAGVSTAGATSGAKSAVATLATETLIVEGARQADLAAAANMGATVLEEGLEGKVLLRAESVERAFAIVEMLLEREVGSVTPNFIRRAVRPQLSAPAKAWALGAIGAPAAWRVTRGSADVSVAILDEGVDTSHPALRAAVVAQRDFIGQGGASAMPAGDDAHGTACAGIAVSRSRAFPGVAPRCSLIAARIAMGDGGDGWVFDDFATADAIDWCWRQGAAVLSNSWGGGAPSDAIIRAFGRARTQGRNARGSVVAIAAGNDQVVIDFPGNLPGYLTVGASNPNGERKTRASSDGENWWGSNFGPTLQILAPGVFIWTTDIAGARGYETGDFTKTFNGTSAATPHVAGTAALMMSANPTLSASDVRRLLVQTAEKLPAQQGWTAQLGFGRLDVAAAVRAAKPGTSISRPKSSPRSKGTRKQARRPRAARAAPAARV